MRVLVPKEYTNYSLPPVNEKTHRSSKLLQ